jgi:hypothetical protein
VKHDRLLINATEWFSSNSNKSPVDALNEVVKFLKDRGFVSLETGLALLLEDFLVLQR